MFNEAFWVFYLAGISQKLEVTAYCFIWLAVIVTVFFGMWVVNERPNKDSLSAAKKYMVRVWASCGVVVTACFFFPSEDAIYAGATQSVIEYAEVDDTLVLLKEALDEKLEEIGGKEDE